MRLKGKICLITNCGDMQGPAIAAEFQREGAIIFLQAKDYAKAKANLAKAGVNLEDGSIHVLEADFGERGVADGHISQLVAEMGRLDVLVNNNLHDHRDQPLLGIAEDDWDSMLRALLTEIYYVSKAALKHMVPARDGKIINCTAAAAIVPYVGRPAYSAARAGSAGLTKALGKEAAAYNIQVNAIAQNYVENPTYFPADRISQPDFLDRIRKQVPLGRLAKGWEQAKLVVFLASDDSDFLCGEVIRFTGGSE